MHFGKCVDFFALGTEVLYTTSVIQQCTKNFIKCSSIMLREQKISLFFLMDGFINMLYSHYAVLVQNHCTAQHGADSPRLSHTLEKQKYISTVLLLSPIQRHNTLNRTLLM